MKPSGPPHGTLRHGKLLKHQSNMKGSTTLSIKTFSKMRLTIMVLFATPSTIDTLHK